MSDTRSIQASNSITESKSDFTLKPFPEEANDFFAFNTVKKQLKVLCKGVDLLTNYYQVKYSANIMRPKQNDAKADFVDVVQFLDMDQLSQKISEARLSKSDYRCTFVLVLPLESHKVSLSYILENKKEAILYIDTLGKDKLSPEIKAALKAFGKKNDITVYYSKDKLQTDSNSCGVMSVNMGRDITSKKEDEMSYEFTPLLAPLKKNAPRFGSSVKGITLPVYLVKLSQLPDSLDHVIKDKTIINVHENKPENIEQFRARYINQINTSKGIIIADSYAVAKGVKYKSLIPILFYLEQIQAAYLSKTGLELPTVLKLSFVKDAKDKLRETPEKMINENLMIFSTQFLEKTLEMVKENTNDHATPEPSLITSKRAS